MQDLTNTPDVPLEDADEVESAVRRLLNNHGADPAEVHIQDKGNGKLLVTCVFAGDRPDEVGVFDRTGLGLD